MLKVNFQKQARKKMKGTKRRLYFIWNLPNQGWPKVNPSLSVEINKFRFT
jgi:hypothetical protein